nr:polypeptide N-acetylgalactosaminyltransferase-like 6 isoform X3 [Odocoileus virginianus texanus]
MFRVLLCLSSFPEHLKEKLEEYMARFSKVRIVRTRKREGLIRTRLLGASVARGEVLTFLDSHCEVNVNWLPPLLNQIALNHKTIVCPMIDVIDHNHFGYEAQAGDAMRGAFDWEMYYKRIPIPPELQRADPSDPFEVSAGTATKMTIRSRLDISNILHLSLSPVTPRWGRLVAGKQAQRPP